MNNLITKEEYRKRLIEIINDAIKLDNKVEIFKTKLEEESNYGDNYHTKPGAISYNIKSTSETAYQRAILNSKILLDYNQNNSFKTGEWIDGELPVVLNKNPRRIAIDLIGFFDGKPAICELKFNKSSNSPIYATIELLTYYCFMQFNADALDKWNVNHKKIKKPFRWNDFTGNVFPYLIVCANNLYWDTWFLKYDKKGLINKKEIINKVHKWGKNLDVNINLFKTEDFDFKLQKGDKDKYTPSIPENSIWKIINE